MKNKKIVILGIATCAAIGVVTSAVMSSGKLNLALADEKTYSVTWDKDDFNASGLTRDWTKADDPTTFVLPSSTGYDLQFKSVQQIALTWSYDGIKANSWGTYAHGFYNETAVKGLKSIKIASVGNVELVFGNTKTTSYDTASYYSHKVLNNEVYDFGGVEPSYFGIYFSTTNDGSMSTLSSITVEYACDDSGLDMTALYNVEKSYFDNLTVGTSYDNSGHTGYTPDADLKTENLSISDKGIITMKQCGENVSAPHLNIMSGRAQFYSTEFDILLNGANATWSQFGFTFNMWDTSGHLALSYGYSEAEGKWGAKGVQVKAWGQETIVESLTEGTSNYIAKSGIWHNFKFIFSGWTKVIFLDNVCIYRECENRSTGGPLCTEGYNSIGYSLRGFKITEHGTEDACKAYWGDMFWGTNPK